MSADAGGWPPGLMERKKEGVLCQKEKGGGAGGRANLNPR